MSKRDVVGLVGLLATISKILPKPIAAFVAVGISLIAGSEVASAAPLAPEVALNRRWAEQVFSPQNGGLPFSFVYGGKHSAKFLRRWTREVKNEKISGTTNRRTLTLTDPATGLEVRAVCLVYRDTAGVDWTVYFTNKGDQDSLR